MNAINQYLNQPESQRMYSEGLALAEQHGNLSHAKVIKDLSVGPMGSNRGRLMQLLEELAKATPKQPAIVQVQAAPVSVQELTPQNGQELDVLLQLRKARQRRAQCSQQLHACDTDEDRAAVCDLIDRATKEVHRLEKQYSHLKRHGTLPIEEDRPLPTTLEELQKERDRISSQRLKVEQRLLFLYSLPENSRKRKHIPDNERKLREINARWIAARWHLKKMTYEPKENDA